MASAHTFEELNRFVRQGAFSLTEIDFGADNLQPEAGTQTTLRWRIDNASDARAQLTLPDVVRAVPLSGVYRLAVGAEPISLSLSCDGTEQAITVTPWIRVPRIQQFETTRRSVLGETLHLRWNVVDCAEAQWLVTSPTGEERLAAEAEGTLELPCHTPGRWTVTLVARSSHAGLSDAATISRTQHCLVTSPPVVFAGLPDLLQGAIGTEQALPIRVTGTRTLNLLMPYSTPLAIGTDGVAYVEVMSTPYELQLCATDATGQNVVRRVRVQPDVEPALTLDLSCINQTLELNL